MSNTPAPTAPGALMKFAVPWPSAVTSINDASYKLWRKQYRSSDDTTYKSVGCFRYKSNALRRAGYTYKKAMLAWDNSHDPQYVPGSNYKRAKDEADKAELGSITSWLDKVDWDEKAKDVVMAGQKESAERFEREVKQIAKGLSVLGEIFDTDS